MARRSIAILSSSGCKVGYTTHRAADAAIEARRAVRESERCIRLVASLDPVAWRPRRSGKDGPLVLQVERRLMLGEKEEGA
jgi:hypothetical protein